MWNWKLSLMVPNLIVSGLIFYPIQAIVIIYHSMSVLVFSKCSFFCNTGIIVLLPPMCFAKQLKCCLLLYILIVVLLVPELGYFLNRLMKNSSESSWLNRFILYTKYDILKLISWNMFYRIPWNGKEDNLIDR